MYMNVFYNYIDQCLIIDCFGVGFFLFPGHKRIRKEWISDIIIIIIAKERDWKRITCTNYVSTKVWMVQSYYGTILLTIFNVTLFIVSQIKVFLGCEAKIS